jgi:hypothetical protein
MPQITRIGLQRQLLTPEVRIVPHIRANADMNWRR